MRLHDRDRAHARIAIAITSDARTRSLQSLSCAQLRVGHNVTMTQLLGYVPRLPNGVIAYPRVTIIHTSDDGTGVASPNLSRSFRFITRIDEITTCVL